ncbi:MAG: AAA family ATPase [Natronomonas sp.]
MSNDGRDVEQIDTDLFITVSGPPGCGVTTLCEALSERLDCGYVSGGEVFREIADDRGMSLSQLTAEASSSDELDRELDRRLQRIAEKWGDADNAFILESRLAGYLAADHADLRIWLDAPEEVRVDRTADREEISAEMRVREVIEEKRYETYYGVDLGNRSFYDLSINTARWSPEMTLSIVTTAIEGYDPDADEGSFETPKLNP